MEPLPVASRARVLLLGLPRVARASSASFRVRAAHSASSVVSSGRGAKPCRSLVVVPEFLFDITRQQ